MSEEQQKSGAVVSGHGALWLSYPDGLSPFLPHEFMNLDLMDTKVWKGLQSAEALPAAAKTGFTAKDLGELLATMKILPSQGNPVGWEEVITKKGEKKLTIKLGDGKTFILPLSGEELQGAPMGKTSEVLSQMAKLKADLMKGKNPEDLCGLPEELQGIIDKQLAEEIDSKMLADQGKTGVTLILSIPAMAPLWFTLLKSWMAKVGTFNIDLDGATAELHFAGGESAILKQAKEITSFESMGVVFLPKG